MVADMALAMGMQVVGFDPVLSIDAAWRLSNEVSRMENLQSLLARSDYVSLHVPAVDATRHMLNRRYAGGDQGRGRVAQLRP
jgi:D-3-phosphoglycerate dehydrogenase